MTCGLTAETVEYAIVMCEPDGCGFHTVVRYDSTRPKRELRRITKEMQRGHGKEQPECEFQPVVYL